MLEKYAMDMYYTNKLIQNLNEYLYDFSRALTEKNRNLSDELEDIGSLLSIFYVAVCNGEWDIADEQMISIESLIDNAMEQCQKKLE